MNIYSKPSFYAHIISSFLLLGSLFIIYRNYSKIMKMKSYYLVILFLLLSLVIGIHGLSHLGLETSYHYLVV